MNKFLHLISFLSAKQKHELSAYLQFQPFNNNAQIALIYDTFLQNNFLQIDTDFGLNKAELNKQFFNLSQAIEKYLKLKILDKNDPINDLILIKALAYIGEGKYLEKYINRTASKLESIKNKGFEQFLLILYINYIKGICFDLPFITEFWKQQQKWINQLKAFISIVNLFLKCIISPLAVNNQTKTDIENAVKAYPSTYTQIMQSILLAQLNNSYSTNQFNDLVSQINQLLSNAKTPTYVVFDLIDSLSHYGRYNNDSEINNYCKQKLFSLNKKAVSKGIYRVNHGYISSINFFNIVQKACLQKNFIWADNFIKEHGKYHHPKIKKENILLVKALVAYYKKDYGVTIQFLNLRHNYIDAIDELLTRSLSSICYFELGYTDLLDAKLETNIKYLRRSKKLKKYHKKGGLIFMNTLRKILHGKTNTPEYKALCQRVSEHNFYFKGWLKKKL